MRPPNYESVFCALRITKLFIVPFEVRNHSLCPGNYEAVSCILRLTGKFLEPSESRTSFLCPPNNGTVSCVPRITINCMLFALQTLVGHELELILTYWLQGTNRPPRHIHMQQTFMLRSSKLSVKKVIGYTEYIACGQIRNITNSMSQFLLEAAGVSPLKK